MHAKFEISKLLAHIFLAQRGKKIFYFIRDKLLARMEMIRSRALSKDKRNSITKTFFYFSYKRYRFYFGIYIPCSQFCASDQFIPRVHYCDIPSPFIMSNNRRTCVSHQPYFFKIKIYNFVLNPDRINILAEHNSQNNKIDHANSIFRQWKTHTIKRGVSR